MSFVTFHAFLPGGVAGYSHMAPGARVLTAVAQKASFRRDVGRMAGQAAVRFRVGFDRMAVQDVLVHGRVTVQAERFRVGHQRKSRRDSVPPMASPALLFLHGRMHDSARSELSGFIAVTVQTTTAGPRRRLTRPSENLCLTAGGQEDFHEDQDRGEEKHPSGLLLAAAHRFALSARSICSTVALTAR